MNFSKQEWITLGVGIIAIIGILLLRNIGPISTAKQQQLTMNEVSKDVNARDISHDPQIQIFDIKEGTGAAANDGSEVTVHYTGTFTDGKKFDSSVDRGQPFTFTLGQGKVIKGWDIGVKGMKVGGKRHLVISPTLGYGPDAYGPIPGKSILVFDVELLGVK